MYPGCFQSVLLAALLAIAHANIMVKTVDGSFVPLSLLRRAPGGPLPIILKNNNDMAYLVTVVMGSPEQEVQMAASLSQNVISVASPEQVNDRSYYNPLTSSSYVNLTTSGITQGISGANITGRFVGEKCALKAVTSAMWNYSAAVLLTDAIVTTDLYPPGARGILGYGIHPPTGLPPNASLLGTYLPPNFTNAVCGIELNHVDDPTPDGIFTMGAVDSSAFTGDFTNVEVPSNITVSWSIPFDTLTYGRSAQAVNVSGSLASFDIYHSNIQLSTGVARELYANIPGSQSLSDTTWSIPCTSIFPISLTFGNKTFGISERDSIVKLQNGTCRGVVTGGATGFARIGAPFLRNVYTQFGAEMRSNGSYSFFVGFANKRLRQPNTASTTSGRGSQSTATALPSTTTVSSVSAAPWMMVHDIRLFSTLLVTSIVAIMFL